MRITMGGYSDPRHLQLNGFSLDGEQVSDADLLWRGRK